MCGSNSGEHCHNRAKSAAFTLKSAKNHTFSGENHEKSQKIAEKFGGVKQKQYFCGVQFILIVAECKGNRPKGGFFYAP